MEINWTALDWLILALPLAIGVFAVKVGSAQVREFHRRTGDTGVIMSIAGLSRFSDEAKGADMASPDAEQAREPEHAEAA
jgi:hypothetical protein